jgi:predicted DNA-binding WGR domain protein
MQILLRRRDPAHRMARFYRMGLQARLLDPPETWDVVREWGRIGSPGTVRADSFAGSSDAESAAHSLAQRKYRKGYR